jgi:Family of unknown function (DUF6122)
MLHILLHVLVPALVARLFFRKAWRVALAIMLATMVVDLDHLLAEPIYDPQRCSMGFHPLHRALPITAYAVMAVVPASRYAGVGLLIHMGLDTIDCQVTSGLWWNPQANVLDY